MIMPIFLLLGGFFGSWFDNLFINAKQVKNNFMQNFQVNQDAFKFLEDYEGFKPKAYKVNGENFYTIGIGSTRIFSNDGKNSRSVKSSDVVTMAQAVFNVFCYYNSSSSPKNALDAIIKKYGFKFNQKFYDMLCVCTYASGSIFTKASYQSTLIELFKKADGETDLNKLGEIFILVWVNYLKRYANFSLYGLGWSRRAFGSSQYIKGLNWSQNNANNVIKRPY